MLTQKILKDVEIYSFIDKVERRGIVVYFYYSIDGKQKQKHLPLRSTVKQLQTTISNIKKELGGVKYGRTKIGNYYII
jgi:hypothetical protein